MDLFDAITQRRTHRKAFRADSITPADLNQLIEAARWAPSPFNTQPWELLVIQESTEKNAIADLVYKSIIAQFKDPQFLEDNGRWMRLTGAEWERQGDGVLLTDHVNLPSILRKNPDKLRPLLKHARRLGILGHLGAGKMPAKEIADLVRNSPLLVLVLMNMERRPPGAGAEQWMWIGMGTMIQNLLLAATALRIGVQFVSAPIESHAERERMRQLFSIPDSHEIVTLLRLGYVDAIVGESVRLPASTLVKYEDYAATE